MSTLTGPPPLSESAFVRIARDWKAERNVTVPFPPGDTDFSMARTARMADDPLGLLLDAYERFGPVFTLRLFHQRIIFALGPEANHFMLVSGAQNFQWREGHMGDLLPLLGDGLLTIDGDFHRRSRKIMLPAFHRERIASYLRVMKEETERALPQIRDGEVLDIYHWTRTLALRIAMRALFGVDADAANTEHDIAVEFERALSFWNGKPIPQIVRGPRTPYARMKEARARLDSVVFSEIARRRTTGERGDDIMSLLLDATDEEGGQLSDAHVRDEVMTLLFAGHDTTTSTIAFMFHLLGGSPDIRQTVLDDVDAGSTTQLDLATEETLRLYPPAWIGPRRTLNPVSLAGVRVPADVPVNYSSWASHRLPDVWEDPNRFDPQRFTPENRDKLPKGAYVPFGGGSRMCIGKRFGEAEIQIISKALLERFTFDPVPGHVVKVHQMVTISPRGGLPLKVHGRK